MHANASAAKRLRSNRHPVGNPGGASLPDRARIGLFATVGTRYIGMADQKGNPRTVVLGGQDFETATTTALASSFSIAECTLGSGAGSSTSDRI